MFGETDRVLELGWQCLVHCFLSKRQFRSFVTTKFVFRWVHQVARYEGGFVFDEGEGTFHSLTIAT
jgi:hypothetical protein